MSAARVVIDSNVLLDWLHFADPACAALERAVQAGRLQPVTRADCRDEWWRLLAYPVLGLTPAAQQALRAAHDRRLQCLDALPPRPLVLPRCRDPDDQKWLELARDAGATLLLSRDLALLRMAPRLRRLLGLRICRPDQLETDTAPGR
jgi:predicted nucleic acid-binding protein